MITYTPWNLILGTLILLTEETLSDYTESDFRVFCVFGSWIYYRRNIYPFTPDDLDTELCTDIVYDRANLNDEANGIVPGHPEIDIDKKYYNEVLDLKSKNPELKVHLLIGGWPNSATDRFSRMAQDPLNREMFIKSIVEFLREYNFDGINVAWMFPVCWHSECTSGPSEDKQNFMALMKELRETLDQDFSGLSLSAVVSGDKDIADKAYDMPELANLVDFLFVMTYDMFGPWSDKTAHHAPLYIPEGVDAETWSVDDAIQLWLANGAPSKKVILGIPIYGVSFTTIPPSCEEIQCGVGVQSSGPGSSSDIYWGERMTYFEICSKVKDEGWIKVSDQEMGPYVYKGNQWVGYDDKESVARKAAYIRDNGLKGASMWEIAFDDSKGRCCQIKNPLLNTVSFTLLGKGEDPKTIDCQVPSPVGPLF